MKILALVPYPLEKGPSQRFRLEVFLPYVKEYGLEFDLAPFYSDKAYEVLYSKGQVLLKAWLILIGYIKRYALLFRLHRYDMVYIQREVSPLGPPVIPWLLKYVFKKPYVFDFDDAIWIPNYSSNNAIFHRLKMYRKTKYLIKWAKVCSAGNEYLKSYAQQFNSNTVILPTVVDTEAYHKVKPQKDMEVNRPVLGWTGTHSTMKYIEALFPILRNLEKDHSFELLIISNSRPEAELNSMRYIEWSRNTEIEDLYNIDLGLMPLEDGQTDEFALGKCGFKLIQYMALGIPAIASEVGVNGTIVEHGVDGLLCNDKAEWEVTLTSFLRNPESWKPLGQEGRKKIESHYSVKANLQKFNSLFIKN